ncbi:hypothetical protein [Pseudaestuariivita rosea]|uniref:hypothetical protein n=1 Tax=Pseudaestuariivita rosea TaxID=2763263 RepID=UPI001F17538D|nr:hypothetical protein [Pseudaestuariivita rosea]
MTDFEDMVRINVNRIDHLLGRGTGFATGFFCFMLTGLGLLGFYYSFETAQAIFLLAMPASIVLLMTVNKARKFQQHMPTGDDLRKQILMLRFWIQLIGVIAILITSFWGMYYNTLHNTAWF